jgi:hypothetical protein
MVMVVIKGSMPDWKRSQSYSTSFCKEERVPWRDGPAKGSGAGENLQLPPKWIGIEEFIERRRRCCLLIG